MLRFTLFLQQVFYPFAALIFFLSLNIIPVKYFRYSFFVKSVVFFKEYVVLHSSGVSTLVANLVELR